MPADLLSKPQPHAAPPLAYAESLTLILDPPPAKTPGSSESTCAAWVSVPKVSARSVFSDSLLELSDTRPPHPTRRIVVSLLMHVAAIGIILLVPLYFTDAIDLTNFTQTFLIAPPPPPAPPPPSSHAIAKAATPRHVFISKGKLLAPTFIPQKIAMLKESAPEPDLGGIGEGVIGGVPGGQLGGVIGGVVSGSHTNVPPPTALGAPKKPLRVGGRVKPPRIIQRVAPLYPPLAKQTHIQGVVQIDAVIDAQGNVVEMQAVSGHILLIPAALNAVSQWKFEPTYLNDQPIPIQFVVTVTFQLSQ